MMAIGDVKRAHSTEGSLDKADIARIGERPRGVPHAVDGRKITGGFCVRFVCKQIIEFADSAVDEEDGPGLRIQGLDVADAVVFLVNARQLMFLDSALQVLFATG